MVLVDVLDCGLRVTQGWGACHAHMQNLVAIGFKQASSLLVSCSEVGFMGWVKFSYADQNTA